jgi:hypothetical protein
MDFDLEVDMELIEYWRGMFAQRRFYLDHKSDYASVCVKIIDFQLFAEELYIGGLDGLYDVWDKKKFELNLLEHFSQKGTVSDLVSKIDPDKLDSEMNPSEQDELVQWAFDESTRCGYVVSDLLMGSKRLLVETALGMDESYSAQQTEDFAERIETALRGAKWEGEITIGSEIKMWGGPRLYGPNALPGHRLKSYTPQTHEQLFSLMNESDEPVDFMLGIDGIYAEDFNLDVTVAEVERQILWDRCAHFIAEKRKITRDVEAFARRSPDMKSVMNLFKHDQYEKWNKAEVGDSGLDLMAKTVLEHCNAKTLKIQSAHFLEEDLKDVRELFTQYRKLTRTLDPILTRVKKQEKAKSPRSSVTAELSRACGLYLWDSVYMEGQKRSEALESLAELIVEKAERHLKSETTMYRWLRIIDRCIRENLFLPMIDA